MTKTEAKNHVYNELVLSEVAKILKRVSILLITHVHGCALVHTCEPRGVCTHHHVATRHAPAMSTRIKNQF